MNWKKITAEATVLIIAAVLLGAGTNYIRPEARKLAWVADYRAPESGSRMPGSPNPGRESGLPGLANPAALAPPKDPGLLYLDISSEVALRLHSAGALFIDARRSSAYEQGRIANAINIPVWEHDADGRVSALQAKGTKPDAMIVAYCTRLAAFPPVLARQKAAAAQAAQAEKQIRISVGLVQTDVMVFDKQGHFVSDLKKEQFELRVDGKVQPIQFFEMVSAGSPHDEEIWAKAEGKPAPEAAQQPAAKMANPGRTLFIFLDDWHMEADSTMRTRNAVASLLNTSMGPNDRVGIVAATGQLAATQFLTNDKAALLASLEKFNYKNPGVQDLTYPAMSEAQAQAIEQNDYNTIAYFVGGIVGAPVVYNVGRGWGYASGVAGNPGDLNRAERDTRQRAKALAQTSALIGMRTLSALRGLVQFAESLPGRKLIFFLSDGFVLQYQQSDILAQLTDLTSAAARAGIIIYSLDSRGLVTGTPDVKTKPAPDVTGQRMTMAANEVSAPWDALNALASDTGGRFLKNTNALDTALITSLNEMSRYYLLGWPIDPENLRAGKTSTIKASIKGRSDLTVRVRQGTLDLSKLVREKK